MFNNEQLRIFKRLLDDDLQEVNKQRLDKNLVKQNSHLVGYWQLEFKKIKKLLEKVEGLLNE
jgi:hypothetical protein